MKCDKSAEITAFLKGEVSEAERESLRLHFESCAACGRELEKFDRVLKALGKLETVEPSPGFRWRVREAFLRAHPEFLEAPRRPAPAGFWASLRQTLSYVPAWAVSVAAHVILIAVATLVFFTPRSPEEIEEERALYAHPFRPKGGAPSFPEGPPRREPADRFAHIPPRDPVEGEYTPPSGSDPVVRPKPLPRANAEKILATSALWRQRLPKDRRLLAFFDGRFTESQRKVLREAYGGAGTEGAIRAALNWLARQQEPDGKWGGPVLRTEGGVEYSYSVGLTGLALLAFLGEGHTTRAGDYTRTVQRGLDFLLSEQRSSGLIGSDAGNYMYNHAVAALAVLEAALMTRDEALQSAATMAVSFTMSAQNADGGWGYSARSPASDTSVGGWQILLLRIALLGGNQGVIPALLQAHRQVERMTDAEGRVGYRSRLNFPNGYHGTTAVGMLSHLLSTHTPDPELLARQAQVILERPAILGTEAAQYLLNDLYFGFFGSMAMHQLGGDSWTRWWSPLRERLLRSQAADGSWPASFDRWCAFGGPVYTTAMGALILSTPVRYPRFFE
ncbi:MAG: zf-HC2 domain-containing protein [Planctomycetota bacterium]